MVRERKGERLEHEERTFSVRVKAVPGVLARVDALFRRQRVPLSNLFFEREEGPGHHARLTIVTVASAEAFSLLSRQLRRLRDVQDIGADMSAAPPVPSFILEERTA